ncbi:hypothetical protein [Azospirillum picis]|uniref:Uncharacterized protein n=1 Tax=Azospirillum picis TaxID=488438 RepID=A0ABU0MS04_9PROT|nr:hypothetical protein [Azospirillum picis]MBP2301316.1 hypothetical protein [Azospirillum picis]MBP2302513.1 hypothetical protein [Azospirillum picis]MDQ0535147.1 hypothetical protein [Azospirillum picis]MDQ0536245.1 hypothetical protein [Azospirillum picis]
MANTAGNTPTGVTTLGTIGAAGGQGGWCRITPLATNTAAVVCVLKRKAGEAANIWHLIAAQYVGATTINATTAPVPQSIASIAGMDFEAGDVLGIGSWATLTASCEVDLGWYDLTKPA